MAYGLKFKLTKTPDGGIVWTNITPEHKTMAKYNGHKNWNHWNVSLWLNNDEGLYREALCYIRQCEGKPLASIKMYRSLVEAGITHTPDGAPYSVTTIRAAMVGM